MFRALAAMSRENGRRRTFDLTNDEPHTSTHFPPHIAFIQSVFTMGGGGKIPYVPMPPHFRKIGAIDPFVC